MLEVITLENMNVGTIYKVFENAFTGYFVEFEKKPDVHIQRWLSAGVDFSLSYGVKSDGRLVAFILHSPRENFVMNLATGVMKEFQGKGLTNLMYERIKKDLPVKHFSRSQLEVITENHKAIRAYEKAGFKIKRKLLCWKGEVKNLSDSPGKHDIRKLELGTEHKVLTQFPHAFEQDNSVVVRRSDELELHELRTGNKLVAYAVWNPWKMNLVQFEGEDESALRGLLFRMKLSGEHAGIINVDERDYMKNNFLLSAGLENYLSQYEMDLSFL